MFFWYFLTWPWTRTCVLNWSRTKNKSDFKDIPCSTFILRGLNSADSADEEKKVQQKKTPAKLKTAKIYSHWYFKNGVNPLVLLYIIHWGKRELSIMSWLQTKRNDKRLSQHFSSLWGTRDELKVINQKAKLNLLERIIRMDTIF